MGQWGASPLTKAVCDLNPQAKQAFYAAAASRTINRGTWNGCAFNAGGESLGVKGVSSVQKAAEVFDLPISVVSRFIHAWDKVTGTPEEATQLLRDAITEVGLFSPAGVAKIKSFSVKVFEAQMEQEVAALNNIDELVSDETITDDDLFAMIDGFKEAMEVFCG